MELDTKELLQEIHRLTAEKFHELLSSSSANEIPASTYQVIVGFLKNNDVTADIRDTSDLMKLRDELTEARSTEDIIRVASNVQSIMQGEDILH